jgi:hypothetical protein
MADSGSDKRRQLAEVYAGMTEGELRSLAGEAWSLTKIAKELLKVELTRRGIEIELNESPAEDANVDGLVTLRRFRDLPDAELAKSFLESTGIECFLRDDIAIGMNWGWSNALGGIKVCVRSKDAGAADQLLGEIPDEFDVKGIGQYKQPRCPNCRSTNISLEDLDKPFGLVIGLPTALTPKGHLWTCNSCGHEWPESDEMLEQDFLH